MSYRFDVRSKKQFAKDIKQSHVHEAEIAIRLCIAIHARTKKWPSLVPTGIDSTGEFIEKDSKVTSHPDFSIDGKLVEITRADVVCNRNFHQKLGKVSKAISNQYDLVFVNGYLVDKQPNYIWLTPDILQEFTTKATTKYGTVLHPGGKGAGPIHKTAYRYDVFWFKDLWRPLPVLIDNIPEEYKKIIEATKV
jgi:hypothetical protein